RRSHAGSMRSIESERHRSVTVSTGARRPHPGPLLARHERMDPVLEARGLTKVYRMGEVDVHALRGVDLTLYEGELIVLLGVSGSGKSTLLNIMGGLDLPTTGRVV